jgi:RecA/RadA recombinase
MAEKRKQVIRITTGSKALDGLLGGGIESMRSVAGAEAQKARKQQQGQQH